MLIKRNIIFFKNNLPIFLLILLNFATFINNSFFYLSLLVLYIYKNFFSSFSIVSKYEKYLLYATPIIFYFKKFLDNFESNNLLFWDSQYLFIFFRCNKGLNENYIFLQKVKYGCLDDLGFGLFPSLISADINSWYASIIVFLVSILFFTYLTIQINLKNLYISILFILSPSFRFLLFSLNPDIIFLIGFLYLIIYKKFEINNFGYILLTIFIQTKFFPMGILLGIVIYFFLNNERDKLKKLFYFILFNLLFIIYEILISDVSIFPNTFLGVPYVFAPIYSFGVLADFKTFFEVQLNSNLTNYEFIKIISLLFFIFFIFVNIRLRKINFRNFSLFEIRIFVCFMPMIYIINFFGNYGYKLPFNFILIFLLFIHSDKYIRLLLIFFIIFNPLFHLLNFEYAHQLFDPTNLNSVAFAISRISFYLTNYIYLFFFLKMVRKKNINY